MRTIKTEIIVKQMLRGAKGAHRANCYNGWKKDKVISKGSLVKKEQASVLSKTKKNKANVLIYIYRKTT